MTVRDTATCCEILRDMRDKAVGRFQLTTDGLATYTSNARFILRERVDNAELIKHYESSQSETRYSPAKIISAEPSPG